MKNILLATIAATLVASVAVPAMAAPQGEGHRGPRIERMMERFDANRDGAVMLDEIAAHRTAMFESADTDKSGTLSEQEIAAFGEMHKAERKKARDERRAERGGDQNQKMGKHHGKRDGEGRHADRHEGKRGEGRHADRHEGKRGEGRHAGKHDGKRGEGRHGGPSLERLDTDKNGEISVEEFAAMDTTMFERFDRNGDNKIDITDFYGKRADNN
ncbi:EF-hand domain-containing protein [Hoeflea sp. G2-23]|uniref:EF-hand domain-containing protein n=1 Tax=Hoeflea algicola TaxID=2983763 RepID=A0ABT3ZCT1_9HYPH|nr:EF-hand domain-containing protein [Hoeflea algicola]MCY0149582.1 EF-hand domain-containing protein [Hoeflea algicola]